jgi:hypothetical protein
MTGRYLRCSKFPCSIFTGFTSLPEIGFIDEKEWNEYIEEAQKTTPGPSSPIQPGAPFPALASETFNHPTHGTLQPCLVSSSIPSPDQTSQNHGAPIGTALPSSHPTRFNAHLGPLYTDLHHFLEMHFRHALASFPLRREIVQCHLALVECGCQREGGIRGGARGMF